jgi:hypothetical protein
MATLLFDDVFFPVGHEHLIGAGAEFAREQKLRTVRITSAWHSIDSIDSSFTEPDFKAMLFKPPEELVFDKQGNWRRSLRGAVHTEVAKYFNVSPNRLRSQFLRSRLTVSEAIAADHNRNQTCDLCDGAGEQGLNGGEAGIEG